MGQSGDQNPHFAEGNPRAQQGEATSPRLGLGLAPKPVPCPQTQLLPKDRVLGALCRHNLWTLARGQASEGFLYSDLSHLHTPGCRLCSHYSVLQRFHEHLLGAWPVLGDWDEQKTTDWWEMDRQTDRRLEEA